MYNTILNTMQCLEELVAILSDVCLSEIVSKRFNMSVVPVSIASISIFKCMLGLASFPVG